MPAPGPRPSSRGPTLSLAKAFRMGPKVRDLVERGAMHPALEGILEHPELFAHQWETLEQAREGRHCLVSTGTGCGKTEAFPVPGDVQGDVSTSITLSWHASGSEIGLTAWCGTRGAGRSRLNRLTCSDRMRCWVGQSLLPRGDPRRWVCDT